jgi:ribonuclease BN (tRNA processing enzyme)
MRLHVLGCGDAFGSGGRLASSYLLESETGLFLIDCGPSALAALKRAGFSPWQLQAVLLSHLHGDHFGGLPFFFIDALYANPRATPLHIAGPAATEERVRRLFYLMYGQEAQPKELPPVAFHLLQPDRPTVIQGIEIFPFRVPHQLRDVSLGLKITCAGKQILFSGDSAWTDAFITHANGVDLFLCECCFFDQETASHMSFRALEKHLNQLQCKKIVLTHMGEEMLARRGAVPLPTAEDGMVIEF